MQHVRSALPVLVGLFSLSAQEPTQVFAPISLPAACEQARTTGRKVLIDFSTAAVEPCRRLQATTWQDVEVRRWIAANAIAVRVDPEEQSELARQHRIDAYPTVVLLAPDGSEALRVVGYVDGAGLLARLAAAAESASTDTRVRMRLGDDLARQGDPAGALRHYLWCWDHGLEHNRAFTGVRTSFLLSRLADLAKDHAPAQQALAERRDAVEQRVLAGATDLQAVTDMVELNAALGTEPRSLAVFDKVPPARWRGQDIARRVMFEAVLEQLLAAKRYADALRFCGDPQRELEHELTFLQLPGMPRDFVDGRKQRLVEKYASLVEVYFGLREVPAATALGDRLLELQEDSRTWGLLIDAARRAGSDVQAHDLVVRALADLPPEEHAAIRQRLQPK